MNLASYQLLQPAMCAAYLHRRAAFKSDKFEYKINYFLEETEDSNPHLTTIRTVSSSCRCASNYTCLLFDFYHEWAILTSFGFSELFHVHQTATFWAVLAPTILRSGVVRLLTWCRLAGFSYVVRPFARSRHPLMLSSYFFYTHTISVHQVKELSSMSAQWNSRLTQDCRCPNDLLYKV